MAAEPGASPREALLEGLRELQAAYGSPIADTTRQSPRAALESLEEAVADAPAEFREYLKEALGCYNNGLFRAAVLMVWAATMQHLYMVASRRPGGLKAFEAANLKRLGGSKNYRKIRKGDDFLYLRDWDFIQFGEDAGMFNRNLRRKLHQRLELRNDCGHPTKYKPGRDETVVFIESLILNVLGGAQLNW